MVCGWEKDEEKLRTLVQDMEEDAGLKRKHACLAKDQQLGSALHQWFVQARAEGVPIFGAIVQARAEKFDRNLNGEDSSFKASTGWLDPFKEHHSINQVSVSGEIWSADSEAAQTYPDQLQEIIDEGGYSPDQIYNADETDLCYRMLPGKTLAVKNDEHKREGFKKIKDRLTILFCLNKTGNHKVEPLCIGKFKNRAASTI